MSNIMLSYRRSDSADATARIHDHLETYFGRRIIFRDVDGIQPGVQFPAELDRQLRECQIAAVVIGPQWLEVRAEDGARRIDSAADFVRIEVATLLSMQKPVIPVLVSGASMPRHDQLPPDIASLAYINAITLPATSGFEAAMKELARRIHAITKLPYEDFATTLRQCQSTGLVTVLDSFLDDRSVRDEIRDATELIVVMNDGRNFVNDNQELLRARIEDPRKTSTFVFCHPRSEFLPTLVRKNGKGERQWSEMKASFDLLSGFGARNLFGHHLFNPCSLTMSENYAFVSPYRFLEGGALPLFKFSSYPPSGYYHTLRRDALALIETSHPLTAADFAGAYEQFRNRLTPRQSLE